MKTAKKPKMPVPTRWPDLPAAARVAALSWIRARVERARLDPILVDGDSVATLACVEAAAALLESIARVS